METKMNIREEITKVLINYRRIEKLPAHASEVLDLESLAKKAIKEAIVEHDKSIDCGIR